MKRKRPRQDSQPDDGAIKIADALAIQLFYLQDALADPLAIKKIVGLRQQFAGALGEEPNPDFVYAPKNIHDRTTERVTPASLIDMLVAMQAGTCLQNYLASLGKWDGYIEMIATAKTSHIIRPRYRELLKPEVLEEWDYIAKEFAAIDPATAIVKFSQVWQPKFLPAILEKLGVKITPIESGLITDTGFTSGRATELEEMLYALQYAPDRFIDHEGTSLVARLSAMDHAAYEYLRYLSNGVRRHVLSPWSVCPSGLAYREIPQTAKEIFPHILDVLRLNASRLGPENDMKQVGDRLLSTSVVALPDAVYWHFTKLAIDYSKALDTPEKLKEVMSKPAAWPERWPFAQLFLCYEPPIAVPQNLDGDDTPGVIYLIGELITKGSVWSLILEERDKLVGWWPQVTRHCRRDEWIAPYYIGYWTLPATIAWINDHIATVEERAAPSRVMQLRKELSKERRKQAPPPYYTVRIRDELITRSTRATFKRLNPKPVEWSHRWETMGHSAHRVMRGPLPMDEKLKRHLLRRGYKVYEEQEVDFHVWSQIKHQPDPKQPDEWMAIKRSWQPNHIKGPEDKPFIPSIHESKKQVSGGVNGRREDREAADRAGASSDSGQHHGDAGSLQGHDHCPHCGEVPTGGGTGAGGQG